MAARLLFAYGVLAVNFYFHCWRTSSLSMAFFIARQWRAHRFPHMTKTLRDRSIGTCSNKSRRAFCAYAAPSAHWDGTPSHRSLCSDAPCDPGYPLLLVRAPHPERKNSHSCGRQPFCPKPGTQPGGILRRNRGHSSPVLQSWVGFGCTVSVPCRLSRARRASRTGP